MVTNYLDVMKDGRGAFSITGWATRPAGVVSPSSDAWQGLGLSEGPKKPTIIAGTKTDLRRLSMGKAEQILKTLGVPAEEIAADEVEQDQPHPEALHSRRRGWLQARRQYGGFARSHRSPRGVPRIYQRNQDVFNKMALALSEAVMEEPAAGAGGGPTRMPAMTRG